MIFGALNPKAPGKIRVQLWQIKTLTSVLSIPGKALNKETLGAVILDQAAEFHPTAFLAEYDKASLERMSQNVTNVFVDLLLFPFVEARKVGPKSHKASFLRQLHSKKMEDGEEMHFLLAPRCGILGKQIVDRRCFLWSL